MFMLVNASLKSLGVTNRHLNKRFISAHVAFV